jgi:hypothetical protein
VGTAFTVPQHERDKQANAAGLVVQIVAMVGVLVGALVGLGAVVLLAIGSGDDDDEPTNEPATVDFATGAELAAALGCANTVAFDGLAHLTADPAPPAPEAFQCTVGELPVFAYVYQAPDARRSALDAGQVSRNLCTSFPSDATPPAPFDGVIGTNWLLATRSATFADDLNQRLGGGGLRREVSCVIEG